MTGAEVREADGGAAELDPPRARYCLLDVLRGSLEFEDPYVLSLFFEARRFLLCGETTV